MNGIALFDALTKIDGEIIDRAAVIPAQVPVPTRRPAPHRWAVAAEFACFVAIFGGVLLFYRVGMQREAGVSVVTSSSGGDVIVAPATEPDTTPAPSIIEPEITAAPSIIEPEVVVVEGSYNAVLAEASDYAGRIPVGEVGYSDINFSPTEYYEKTGMESKTETINGKTITVNYSCTYRYASLSYEIDCYGYNAKTDYTLIRYRADTGRIVAIDVRSPVVPDGGPVINADSSEEEIIAYAKTVLYDVTKTSANGWNAVMKETVIQVPQADHKTANVHGYTVTFFKTIGGFKRADQMVVRMTDEGAIVNVNAINDEEAFAPFLNVKPDRARIIEAATAAYDRSFGETIPDYYSAQVSDEILLFPQNGSLWAEVKIQSDGGADSFSFVVEVARILNASADQSPATGAPATAPLTDPVTTDPYASAHDVPATDATVTPSVHAQDAIVVEGSYVALSAESGGSVTDETGVVRYADEKFFKPQTYKKTGMERKTESFYGTTGTVYYDRTYKAGPASYEIDVYKRFVDDENMYVQYRADTGKIVRISVSPPVIPDGGSAIDVNSSEEEIIAYAKTVLYDVTETSANGWRATVEDTYLGITQRDQPGGYAYVHGYIVTFFKTIGCFKRADQMVVEMTDEGAILHVNAINYEETIAPFLGVVPDRAKVEGAASAAYVSDFSYPGYISDVTLFPKGGSLWAEVTFSYRTDGGSGGGFSYMVEVARILNASFNETPAFPPATESPVSHELAEYAPPFAPGEQPWTTAQPATTLFMLEEEAPSATVSP